MDSDTTKTLGVTGAGEPEGDAPPVATVATPTPPAPPEPPADEVATVATQVDHAIDRLAAARALPEATEATHGHLTLRRAVAATGCIERFMDADDRTMCIVITENGTLFKAKDIDPQPEEA